MDRLLSTTLQAPKQHNGAEPTEKNLASIATNLNHPNAHNRRIAQYYYAKLTGSPVSRSSTDIEDLREERAKLHNSWFWIWLRLTVLGVMFATVETALILMLTADPKIAVGVGVTGCIVVAIVTGVVGWRMVIEDQEGIKGKERKCQMALAELYAAEERHNLKNQKKWENAQRNLEDGLGWACSNSVKSENEEELGRGEPSLGDPEEVGTMKFGEDDDPGPGMVLVTASEARGLLPPLNHDRAKRNKAGETDAGQSSTTKSSTATATHPPYERKSRRLLLERTTSQTSASTSKPNLKDNLPPPSSTPANSSMSRSKPSLANMYRKLSVRPTPSDVQESLDNACSKDVAFSLRGQATRSNSTVSGSRRVPYSGRCRTTVARPGSLSNYKDLIADGRNPYSHRQMRSHGQHAKARNGNNMPIGISEASVRDQETSIPSFPPRSTFTHAVPERGSSLGGPSCPYAQSTNQQSHHSCHESQMLNDFYSSERSILNSVSPPPLIFRSRSEIAAQSCGSDTIRISATPRPFSFVKGQEPPLPRVQPNQEIQGAEHMHGAEHIKKDATDASAVVLGEPMDSILSLEAPAAAQANDDSRSLPSLGYTRRESPYMRRYIPRQYLKEKASDEENAMHELISAANGNFALSEGESSDDGPFELPTLSAPQEVGEISHAPIENLQETAKVWEGLGMNIVHEKEKCEMLGLR
jgi:hypothetical protein